MLMFAIVTNVENEELNKNMKNLKKELTKKLKSLRVFFIDSYGWLRSVVILYLKGIERPRIFYGFNHYKYAQRYAHKRVDGWKPQWDQLGKQQSVHPYGDHSLIVLSQAELKIMKKLGMVNTRVSAKKIFKRGAYYKTN